MGKIEERPGQNPVDANASDATADSSGETGDPWASFDRWASNLFLIFAVVGLLVILTIGGLARNEDGLVLALTLAIAVMAAALLLGTSIGLDRKRGWARATAVGVLVITLVAGVVGAVADFTRGTLTIPLGSIIAALVLAKKPGPLPGMSARDGRITVGLLALYVVASLGGVPAWLLTQEASPLIADRDQLDLAVTSDCPGGAVTAGTTTRVDVTLSWTWRSRDLAPLRGDAVELSWGDPASVRARFDEAQLPAGATIGGDGPGIQLLQRESGTSSIIGMGPGLSFSDNVVFSLPPDGPSGDGRLVLPLDVQPPDGGIAFDLVARYAHGSAWTQVAETSCLVRAPGAGAVP